MSSKKTFFFLAFKFQFLVPAKPRKKKSNEEEDRRKQIQIKTKLTKKIKIFTTRLLQEAVTFVVTQLKKKKCNLMKTRKSINQTKVA